MSTATIDLWGPEITIKRQTPLTILRAQAVLLEQKTGGILRGKIQTTIVDNSTKHELLVFAPLLDNYSLAILSATHHVDLVYPVHVSSRGLDLEFSGTGTRTAEAQVQFVELLAHILVSPYVRGVLDSLIAQSNEAAEGTSVANG